MGDFSLTEEARLKGFSFGFKEGSTQKHKKREATFPPAGRRSQ